MNRRSLLAAPAALALGAVPALAEAETPILRLYRQHKDIIEAAKRHVLVSTGLATDDEYERLFYGPAYEIEKEMMALPCTCAADFAAKVIVDTVEGNQFSDWETGTLWAEARALVG